MIVSSGLHLLELDLGPGVHRDRSDEANVDAEAAVLPGAFEAHEDSVGYGGPLRVLLGAVDARPVPRLRLELAQAAGSGGVGHRSKYTVPMGSREEKEILEREMPRYHGRSSYGNEGLLRSTIVALSSLVLSFSVGRELIFFSRGINYLLGHFLAFNVVCK